MFCGIVETTGIITSTKANGCKHLIIKPEKSFEQLTLGDSIAINGVCLTITNFTKEDFSVTIVPETLSVTNLENLQLGSKVNLERSITVNTRIGGHFMQGHVDCVGEITSYSPHQNSDAHLVTIKVPEKLIKYIVKKGFISVDGMSLTVIEVGKEFFTLTLIPHTKAVTIAESYQVGSLVNIEVDMLGKYIEKLLEGRTHVNTN